jgi:hypothetical protein
MALQPLSARNWLTRRRCLPTFRDHVDRSYKTVGQLLAIYRERGKTLRPPEDRADDLRVEANRSGRHGAPALHFTKRPCGAENPGLIESTALVFHVAELYPGRGLPPGGAQCRLGVRMGARLCRAGRSSR